MPVDKVRFIFAPDAESLVRPLNLLFRDAANVSGCSKGSFADVVPADMETAGHATGCFLFAGVLPALLGLVPFVLVVRSVRSGGSLPRGGQRRRSHAVGVFGPVAAGAKHLLDDVAHGPFTAMNSET